MKIVVIVFIGVNKLVVMFVLIVMSLVIFIVEGRRPEWCRGLVLRRPYFVCYDSTTG